MVDNAWLEENIRGPAEADLDDPKLLRVTSAFSATWNKRGAFGEKLTAKLLTYMQAAVDADHPGAPLTLAEAQGVVKTYREYMETQVQLRAWMPSR